MKRSLLLGCILVIFAGHGGCERSVPQRPQPVTSDAITRTSSSPLATLTVQFNSSTIDTSELLTATVTVVSSEDARISPPDVPSQESLRVLESWPSPATRRPDGTIEQVWTFTLEPDLAGTWEAPSVRVGVRNAESGEVSFLSTDPAPITVESLLESTDPGEITQLRATPAPPPPAGTISETLGTLTAGVVIAALVVIFLAAGGVFYLARRNRTKSIIPSARRSVARHIDAIDTASPEAVRLILADAASTLRRCVAERAELDAPALTASELSDACPEILSVGRIRPDLEAIEAHLFSGAHIEPDAARSLLISIDHSLDELATFVPTRYVDDPGAVA